MSTDYYSVLDVDKNATQDEIKKAFRKKAHQYHPDKTTGDEAKFKEVNQAYQVLGDKDKRAQYDQFGSGFENAQAGGSGAGFSGFSNASGFNINMDDLGDIFSGVGDIFGGFSGRREQRQSSSNYGNDINVVLEIEFNDAVFGAEKEIVLNKKVKCDRCNGNMAEPGTKIITCKVCNGTGRVTKIQRTILGQMQVQTVCDNCGGEGKIYTKKCTKCKGTGIINENVKMKIKIPAGIDNGETIRLRGYGEAGEGGGANGDLYLKINVKQDNKFKRDEYDIRSESEINFEQAVFGDKIDIETVEGVVKLKIPAGTQSGTIFKIRNKGIANLRGTGKGDHFVKVKIKTPTNLSRKQKNLLKEIRL